MVPGSNPRAQISSLRNKFSGQNRANLNKTTTVIGQSTAVDGNNTLIMSYNSKEEDAIYSNNTGSGQVSNMS